jgi:hypothetical protein
VREDCRDGVTNGDASNGGGCDASKTRRKKRRGHAAEDIAFERRKMVPPALWRAAVTPNRQELPAKPSKAYPDSGTFALVTASFGSIFTATRTSFGCATPARPSPFSPEHSSGAGSARA